MNHLKKLCEYQLRIETCSSNVTIIFKLKGVYPTSPTQIGRGSKIPGPYYKLFKAVIHEFS